MIDEELNALVRDAVLAADCMQETGTFETGQGILHDCARAITTLRAQLAEARAERDRLLRAVLDILHRADRAEQRVATLEAALAAQIEADAGIADECERQNGPLSKRGSDPYVQGLSSAGQAIAAAIRAQPHDRTALDRMLTDAREKALREAAQACDWGDIYGDNAVRTILALIEKPNAG